MNKENRSFVVKVVGLLMLAFILHLSLTDSVRIWLTQSTANDPYYVDVMIAGPVRYPGHYQIPGQSTLKEVSMAGGGLKKGYTLLENKELILRKSNLIEFSEYTLKIKARYTRKGHGKRYRKSRY